MSKHTPGPWKANVTRECISDAGDCYSHWNIWSDNSTVCCIYHGDHDETNEANARLIAAAPELLEALKVCSAELFAQCADHPRAMLFVKEARAAIAKAEGKTNE